MRRHLENMLLLSGSTVVSRVLGLGRDILIYSMLGAGVISSSFLLAFSLPNLLRRLLGEGAMTSALIPVLTQETERGGLPAAFTLLNRVLTRLALLLVALVALGAAAGWALTVVPGLPDRWYLGAGLTVMLLPYTLLICLAAVISASLNTLHSFLVPSLSPIWLNLAMIAALGLGGTLLATTPEGRVGWLCAGVLAGGLAQLLVPAWDLRRRGWVIRPDRAGGPGVQRVFQLLLPGLAGAAVIQVNAVVSRLLAFGIDEQAVSILFLANRLIELPLGVFTIAITTVLFPAIARAAARGDREGFASAYHQGARLILAITVPAALGLILLAEPILRILFEYGRFTAEDARLTVTPLVISALGLPFYSYATLATRGFHARQDTATPARVAGLNFGLNLLFSLILMFPFGMNGLATANLLSNGAQCVSLARLLQRRDPSLGLGAIRSSLTSIGLAATALTAVVLGGRLALAALPLPGKLVAALQVGLLIPAGVAVYALALDRLGFPDREEFRRLLARFTGRRPAAVR